MPHTHTHKITHTVRNILSTDMHLHTYGFICIIPHVHLYSLFIGLFILHIRIKFIRWEYVNKWEGKSEQNILGSYISVFFYLDNYSIKSTTTFLFLLLLLLFLTVFDNSFNLFPKRNCCYFVLFILLPYAFDSVYCIQVACN